MHSRGRHLGEQREPEELVEDFEKSYCIEKEEEVR